MVSFNDPPNTSGRLKSCATLSSTLLLALWLRSGATIMLTCKLNFKIQPIRVNNVALIVPNFVVSMNRCHRLIFPACIDIGMQAILHFQSVDFGIRQECQNPNRVTLTEAL